MQLEVLACGECGPGVVNAPVRFDGGERPTDEIACALVIWSVGNEAGVGSSGDGCARDRIDG